MPRGLNLLRALVWLAAVVLWCLPAAAMWLGAEVHWGLLDFVLAATLLGGSAGMFDLVLRRTREPARLAGVGLGLLGGLLLVWINAAVGIVGAATDARNLAFHALPALVLLVALGVRGRPAAMARTMLGAGFALIVLGIALRAEPLAIAFLGGCLALWLASALAFARAAARGAED